MDDSRHQYANDVTISEKSNIPFKKIISALLCVVLSFGGGYLYTEKDFDAKLAAEAKESYQEGVSDGRTEAKNEYYDERYNLGYENGYSKGYAEAKAELTPKKTSVPAKQSESVVIVQEPTDKIKKQSAPAAEVQKAEEPVKETVKQYDYIINTNTGKFHYTWCSSVGQMKEKNKKYYTGTRESVVNMGYVPCKNCNP